MTIAQQSSKAPNYGVNLKFPTFIEFDPNPSDSKNAMHL